MDGSTLGPNAFYNDKCVCEAMDPILGWRHRGKRTFAPANEYHGEVL